MLSRRLVTSALVAVTACSAWAGVAHASSREETLACAKSYTEAQAARENRSLLTARQRLIECAREVCPAVIQKDCMRWIDEVEVATPTVVLEVRGARSQDVVVSIDGTPRESAARGISISLDPGPHVFRLEAPGRSPLEKELVVYEGEKLRKLVFELSPARAPAAATAPSPAERSERKGGRELGAPFYVTGAVGAAALVTGVALGLSAAADRPTLVEACGSPAGCSPAERDAFGTRVLVADVVVGAGLVSLAAATVLFFTAPSRTTTVAAR